MGRRTMFAHPLHQGIKFSTPMMRTEIGTSPDRRLRIDFNQIGRRITMAHQRQSQSLNAMVHMHASADFRVL